MSKRNRGKPGQGLATPTITLALALRLLDFCEQHQTSYPTPCWSWQGYKNADGYAQVKYRGHKYQASRLAFAAFVGPVPDGMDVDHLCQNPACVNPHHLQCVDPIMNRVYLVRERNHLPF